MSGQGRGGVKRHDKLAEWREKWPDHELGNTRAPNGHVFFVFVFYWMKKQKS